MYVQRDARIIAQGSCLLKGKLLLEAESQDVSSDTNDWKEVFYKRIPRILMTVLGIKTLLDLAESTSDIMALYD